MSIKNKLKNIDSRQFTMHALVVVMLFLLIWFIISNSVFLIKNLDQAFGTEKAENQEITEFDKEGFENLNLLTER
jgi:hypothetical protein